MDALIDKILWFWTEKGELNSAVVYEWQVFILGQKEKLDFLDDDEKKQMGARAKDKHSKDKPHL